MQTGKADSRNRVRDNRKYAADKPGGCTHCYFWKGKRKGCSQEDCYYLLQGEGPISGMLSEEMQQGKEDKNSYGDCPSCPYGRHSPCIGYCTKKILQEMRQKKESKGKEGERLAGRGK